METNPIFVTYKELKDDFVEIGDFVYMGKDGLKYILIYKNEMDIFELQLMEEVCV